MSLIPTKYADTAERAAKTFVQAGVASAGYSVLHAASLDHTTVQAGIVAAVAAAVAAAWNTVLVSLGSKRAAKASAIEALVEKEVAARLAEATHDPEVEVIAKQIQDVVEPAPAQPQDLPAAEQPAQPAA